MAVTFVVESLSNAPAAATTSTTFSITAPAAGNILILVIRTTGTTAGGMVSTITGGGVTTWTKAKDYQQASWRNGEIWYGFTDGTSSSITVNNASAAVAIACLEFSGVDSHAAVDVTVPAGNTGVSSSPVTSSVTPVTNGILLVGVLGAGQSGDTYSSPTNSFNFTTLLTGGAAGANFTGQPAYRIQATAGATTYGATLSTSRTWGAMIVAFRAEPFTRPVLVVRQAVKRSNSY